MSNFFKIKGVIPPMVTPFKNDDSIDFEKFEQNIKDWNKTNLAGYLVLGSNGETPFITEEEKLKLIELTVKNADDNKIVIVGTGLESTKSTIELTNKAAKLGADCALILTPSFYCDSMNDEVLISYFTEVADNSNIPILIYNVTKYTHVNISPKAVSVLSKHPNIIGMKDSSGNISQLISFMVQGLDDEFNLIVGTASCWYPALTIGIDAGIMALANCAPQKCCQVQSFFNEGRLNESLELYKTLWPVNTAVTQTFGVAGLKYCTEKVGFQGGYCRKPLLQLTEDKKQILNNILKKANLIN